MVALTAALALDPIALLITLSVFLGFSRGRYGYVISTVVSSSAVILLRVGLGYLEHTPLAVITIAALLSGVLMSTLFFLKRLKWPAQSSSEYN